jgi:hypothetical protein
MHQYISFHCLQVKHIDEMCENLFEVPKTSVRKSTKETVAASDNSRHYRNIQWDVVEMWIQFPQGYCDSCELRILHL